MKTVRDCLECTTAEDHDIIFKYKDSKTNKTKNTCLGLCYSDICTVINTQICQNDSKSVVKNDVNWIF